MKLTPLNITLACILVWAISEQNLGEQSMVSWLWILLLAVVMGLLDLGFRLVFRNLKKLWLMQIAFVLVVGILVILLKLM